MSKRKRELSDFPVHFKVLSAEAPMVTGQRQDSLTDQLRGLIAEAERRGMYDAADYLKAMVDRA